MVNNMNTGFNGSYRVAKNNKTFSELEQFLILTKKKVQYWRFSIKKHVKIFSTIYQQLLKMIS